MNLNLSDDKIEEIKNTLGFLDMISEDIVRWRGVSMYDCVDDNRPVWDRRLMLENIKKLNGLSLFIGGVTGGVKDEYSIAKELNIDCIVIP